MTPAQTEEFFASQAALFAAGVDARPDVPSHALTVLAAAFRASLMVALVRARHDLGSPFPPLRSSVALALQALQHRGNPALSSQFPFGTAALLALTVQPESVEALLPATSDAPAGSPENLLCSLDTVLSSSFVHGALVSFVAPPVTAHLRLAMHTCENYLAITRALLHGPPDGLPGLFSRAALLFQKRARDSYFAGGVETDGGGADNANTIDFRLAFLYQHSLALGGPQSVPPITAHRWSARAV